MKIKLNKNDLLTKISEELVLENTLKEDIKIYLDRDFIASLDHGYQDKIKKATYFIFQDDRNIHFEIIGGQLVLNTESEAIIGALYNSDEDIIVNINGSEKEIKQILNDIKFEVLNLESDIKKSNFFNWRRAINKALEKNVIKEVEVSKEERIKRESKELLSILSSSWNVTRKHYFFKQHNVDDLIEYMFSSDDISKLQNFILLMRTQTKFIDLINGVENLNDISSFEKTEVLSFIDYELGQGRASSLFFDKYIDFINQKGNEELKKSFENLDKNFEDFFNTDEFYLASKDFLMKNQKILNSKEELLSDKVMSKYIYYNKNNLPKGFFQDLDIFKKILPHLKTIDLMNDRKYLFLENLELDDLVDLWLIDNEILKESKSFLKGYNKKKNFMEFILKLKEKRPDNFQDYKVNELFFNIYRRLKKDKDIVLFLMREDFSFNYFEDLDIKEFDKALIDEMFERDLYRFIPLDIIKEETNKDRIVKFLNLKKEDIIKNLPNHWINQEILFSINEDAFKELNLSNKNFNIKKFTNDSLDVYQKLLEKDMEIYKIFPIKVKENQELFKGLLNRAPKFATENMPNKLLFNKDFMIDCIREMNENSFTYVANIIPQILWEVDDFLVKYLEIIDNSSGKKSNGLIERLPNEIRKLFKELNINENYMKFMHMCYLNESLETKPSTEKVLKI